MRVKIIKLEKERERRGLIVDRDKKKNRRQVGGKEVIEYDVSDYMERLELDKSVGLYMYI